MNFLHDLHSNFCAKISIYIDFEKSYKSFSTFWDIFGHFDHSFKEISSRLFYAKNQAEEISDFWKFFEQIGKFGMNCELFLEQFNFIV